MGRTLVVAEKPSVGRDYAKVLGCRQAGDGCLLGDQYVITWAIGHLVELCEPQEYDPRLKKWNRQDLPILPETMKTKVIKKTAKQFAIIKKWMQDPDIEAVICGTDSGREGELIFRYIYQQAKCRKPFYRLWVSSMTEEAILEGFAELRDGREYDRLYESARCRSEADWLVGINGSRAYTIRYGALLSIGRVQTPTLALLVSRQAEIDSFVPKDYFEVHLSLKTPHSEDSTFSAVWFELEEDQKTRTTKIWERGQAEQILQNVMAVGKAEVESVTKTKKKQLPPLLYDLTELQRDGNRKYGFSANRVLEIAQSLYERHKLVTYPRTDSRYLSSDMKETVLRAIQALDGPEFHPWIEAMPEPVFTKRIVDDSKVTDHHALIPTAKRPDLNRLSDDETKIYRLIAKRLLEVFYPPYEYEITEAILICQEERFLAKGKVVLEPGYTVLSKKEETTPGKEVDSQPLPPLQKGDIASIAEGAVETKQTKPPNPYTEATLLTAMEYAGKFVEDEELREKMGKLSLGTPATRASIIERLLQVGYIVRKNKQLLPTQKGMDLIRILPNELKSPEMTGKWERALERIYQGTMDPSRFMASISRYVQFIVSASEDPSEEKQVHFDREAPKGKGRKRKRQIGICPLCHTGQVLKNSKSDYCSNWKDGCHFTIWLNALERYGVELTDALVRDTLAGKNPQISVSLPQTGEKAKAVLTVTETGLLEFKNLKRE